MTENGCQKTYFVKPQIYIKSDKIVPIKKLMDETRGEKKTDKTDLRRWIRETKG